MYPGVSDPEERHHPSEDNERPDEAGAGIALPEPSVRRHSHYPGDTATHRWNTDPEQRQRIELNHRIVLDGFSIKAVVGGPPPDETRQRMDRYRPRSLPADADGQRQRCGVGTDGLSSPQAGPVGRRVGPESNGVDGVLLALEHC
ncbi:hypothetical protein GCM10008992_25560 [Halorubrum aquaticum]